jgi:4-hydroxy-3-polyprenylbenzoate decarboxylase
MPNKNKEDRSHDSIKQSRSVKRLIVGITGASGVVMGYRLLELLKSQSIETHLVMTRSAQVTLAYETKLKAKDLQDLAGFTYAQEDIGAAISSGSFKTDGMIVIPCSMRTLAEVANGTTSTLLTRAADVVLKERRRLVLMVRETPLHAGHLKNMLAVTEMGAIVYPPVPAFYAAPESIEQMIDHTIGRAMDLFDIELPTVKRWGIDIGPLRRS